MDIELGQVDRITTDAVGQPGERTFFLQARRGDRLVTVLIEKQQVQLLAASVVEILARIGKETGEGAPEEEMGLESPLLPEWRVGRLSIGYEEDRDLLMLEAEELVPGANDEDEDEDEEDEDDEDEDDEDDEDEDDEDEAGAFATARLEALAPPDPALPPDAIEGSIAGDTPEPSRVRIWATREQMLALARHGAAVASRGRPLCRFCDQPLDPEGHVCPAMNGHRRADTE